MYAYEWSQGIFLNYRRLCTRAQQIDACICQVAANLSTMKRIEPAEIHRQLIRSIQGFDKGRAWSHYKRLCKKTPLDVKLLHRFSETVYWNAFDEALQAEFDFT